MDALFSERDKKHFSAFLPFRKRGNEYEFYLQKRSMNAKRGPGLFGLFGGHKEEGEMFIQTFLREIREELEYEPKNYQYFSRYETANGVVYVFIEEVNVDFDSKVHVNEGEYGKFFTAHQVKTLETSHAAGIAVREVNEYLCT
jgi:8-oxo-dGTP pyrophosphatase MutT (NUDIX family)